jgi:outer membrane immunogenic protein
VVGVEVDLDGASLQSTATNPTYNLGSFAATFQAEQKVTWFGTARARLGFLPTDRLLVYATGGLAVARVEEQTLNLASGGGGAAGFFGGGFGFVCAGPSLPICFSGNSNRTVTGWTAGGGLEWAVWDNTTLKAEALYVNLRGADSVNVVAQNLTGTPAGTLPSSFTAAYGRPDFALVRFGFNYRFGAPVVAKY